MKRAVIYLGDSEDWENTPRKIIQQPRASTDLEDFRQECHDYIDRICDKWEIENDDAD